MKRIFQYLVLTGLSGLVCLFLTVPANAQRGGGHSGGGGGGFSRGSGGGGGGGFHGGGGGSFSSGRSAGGFSGGSRISGGGSFSRGNSGFAGGSSFSRGRTTNGFSSPGVSGFQRGSAYSRGGSYSGGTFRRGGVATGYRGGYGSSIRGGFSRGGHYYAGGYGGRSYGYRYSPWSNRGGYFYNRGFYRSAYYPRLGFSLSILPYGYYPFYWGDAQFYYYGGYFYQQNNDQYTVVEPPIGAAVNSLPANAQSITINGQQYYELNGVYYMPVTRDDGSVVYQVAGKDGQLDTYSSPDNGYAPQNDGYTGPENAAPQQNNQSSVAMPEIGDLFYSLPSDSRKIKIGGQLYYVSPDDFYYQEVLDQDGKKAYKVMGTPDDNPGN
ncbi:DUF6515 family protein [Mucilaginibacter sp. UR6-11]|uniref:DUF6515 family protein n=1 Tax=Mucilaginibacter sp. UR6-11 TaxID=1435644 RepID=UPI001E3CA72C|nr:DUF6515 family protein [Mucilaginibacter sp. UR6-11]MCC8425574.1 hypothetical protein [Mucilaginibacter sp. UR6-11]